MPQAFQATFIKVLCLFLLIFNTIFVACHVNVDLKRKDGDDSDVHERFMKDILGYKDANCSSMSHQLQYQNQNENENHENENENEGNLGKNGNYTFDNKIIITGVVFGVESDSQAEFLLSEIHRMGKQFEDYRAVIYDNDISKSGYIVGKISNYPKIYYIPQILHHARDSSTKVKTCAREQALAFMRTQLLRFVKDIVNGGIPGPITSPQPKPFNAQWAVFMDMEEVLSSSGQLSATVFKKIAKEFKTRMTEFTYDSFDVICSNARYAIYKRNEGIRTCYHDVYALIPCEPTFYPSKYNISSDWGLNLNWTSGSPKQNLDQTRIMTARMICPTDANATSVSVVNKSMMMMANHNQSSQNSRRIKMGFQQGLIRVKSCFGGLAFYKMEALIKSGCEYDKEFSCDCEHLSFHTCLSMSGYDGIYVDKTMEYDRMTHGKKWMLWAKKKLGWKNIDLAH